jgi:putative salt-induced outer membrane protein YdiY
VKNFLLVGLAILAFTAHGKNNAKETEVWSPPTPVFSQKFDWLKLRSGEWLKGDIISMYDDDLEFESEEFDIIIFDWDDVSELRSRFDQQIRFANGEVKQGFLIVKEEHLILISGGTEQHYPLSELLSITSSSDDRQDLWDGKITLGMDVNSGNVNQLDYMLTAKLQRRTPFSRFRADFIYNYSKSTRDEDEKVITDTGRFTTYFDWFYSSKMFFRMFDYEHFTDLQQNIRARDTLGVSLGYHIMQNKRLQWDVTLGPSFQKTSYYNTAEEKDQQSGVVAIGTLLDYQVSSRIDYTFDYQLQFVEEHSGKRNSHLKTGLEFELSNDFQLDIIFYLDRVAEPVASINTVPPKSNDYRLVFSLGYDF